MMKSAGGAALIGLLLVLAFYGFEATFGDRLCAMEWLKCQREVVSTTPTTTSLAIGVTPPPVQQGGLFGGMGSK